jgi:hypothetical protein
MASARPAPSPGSAPTGDEPPAVVQPPPLIERAEPRGEVLGPPPPELDAPVSAISPESGDGKLESTVASSSPPSKFSVDASSELVPASGIATHEVVVRSHNPERQSRELPHASLFVPPHFPSLSQSPERHWAPAEHAWLPGSCPFVAAGTHAWVAVSQNEPPAQSTLSAHSSEHVPVG